MPRDMRRAAGSWLEGSAFERRETRGAQLGLPAEGPGSLASPGLRLLAFVIDGVVANLLAGLPYLFGASYGPGGRGYAVYAAFLLHEFVLDGVAGATIGKQLCGIRVIKQDGGRLPWPWVLARTLLLGFLVPAVIWDRDGRGLHDKAAGALTVRAGSRPAAASTAVPQKVAAERESGVPRAAGTPKKASATAKPPVRRRKKRR